MRFDMSFICESGLGTQVSTCTQQGARLLARRTRLVTSAIFFLLSAEPSFGWPGRSNSPVRQDLWIQYILSLLVVNITAGRNQLPSLLGSFSARCCQLAGGA